MHPSSMATSAAHAGCLTPIIIVMSGEGQYARSVSHRPEDLALALERLATLVERFDPVGSGLRVADVVVDGSSSVWSSLGGLIDAATSLASLLERLHRILDDVEVPLRTLAPHLARATGSAERLGDLVPLVRELTRFLGPLAVALRTAAPDPPETGPGTV